ncbi:MAG TPA: purine-nucleoside phosphorylase [Myxococcaceae bacterium]|nr:purine-nucleoside phosphorylase [Myxococcaceae bacterium]
MNGLLELLEESAAAIRARVPDAAPEVALVLGSGLAGAVRLLEDPQALPLAGVPHLRAPVPPFRRRAGPGDRRRSARVGVLQGRLHTYEGWTAAETAFPLRVLIALGARVVVLTNAAGAVREGLAPGAWMLVTDHLNLSGKNPLEGPNDARVGPRFPDLTQAYNLGLRGLLLRAATAAGVRLHEGVYAMMSGPSYETPAEIRMLRRLGADAVGMSTVPEVIAAVHMGARVACLSCITNVAAGMGGALSHAEVEATAQRSEDGGVRILRAFLDLLAGSSGPG